MYKTEVACLLNGDIFFSIFRTLKNNKTLVTTFIIIKYMIKSLPAQHT